MLKTTNPQLAKFTWQNCCFGSETPSLFDASELDVPTVSKNPRHSVVSGPLASQKWGPGLWAPRLPCLCHAQRHGGLSPVRQRWRASDVRGQLAPWVHRGGPRPAWRYALKFSEIRVFCKANNLRETKRFSYPAIGGLGWWFGIRIGIRRTATCSLSFSGILGIQTTGSQLVEGLPGNRFIN